MRTRTALALAAGLNAGCNSYIDALYAAGKDVPPYMETGTSGLMEESTGLLSETGTPDTVSDVPDPETSGPISESAGDQTTGEPLAPPLVVGIDVPPKVLSAGPMKVQVYAERAATVDVVLDGVQVFPLINEGDDDGDGVDVFSGVVPIYGSPDNGLHTLTATARREDLEDILSQPFEVAAPPAGALAWEKYGGPGAKTTRLAVTPDGYVLEAGSFEINGVPRPAVRLRDPVTGGDVWPEGPRVVDAREGSIADVAYAPDGRVWLAMNVREGNTWTARIASFSDDFQPLGAEQEKPGATVTGIASDSASGCLADGFMVTVFGDADILVWRMTAEGAPILSGHPWDYVPEGFQAHLFDDLAFDLVLDPLTDEAWIVGGSQGKHNLNEQVKEVRGIVLHVDIDTFDLLSPVLVAPPAGDIKQSLFQAAWLEPESLLVSGYQCDMLCSQQSVLATRYNFAGIPTWGFSSEPSKTAIGYGIASDTHGTILIAASIRTDALIRGFLLGRSGVSEAFPPVAFPGKDASRADSIVVGPYDWPFVGGGATIGGVNQGYVMHTHP